MTEQMIGHGDAHSKIILMGEHSVVYGFPAIAMPLQGIRVSCQVTASDQPFAVNLTDPLSTAVYAALEHLGQENAPIRYEIVSNVPQRRGMGSSAAVSIAAIRAVYDYFGQTISHQDLEILVNQSEIIAHTNPSGLDAKTCLSDELISYIRNVGFKRLAFEGQAYLVIADTGIHGQTSEAIQKVQDLQEKALPHLNRLGLLAEQFEGALLASDYQGMGEKMTQAHASLKALGVSCEASDRLVAQALATGALGAKMTGGGLGGCIIALADTESLALDLQKELKQKGAKQTWIEKM
ncbi:mevalonate kinase [Streptococcus sp. DD12]|uniref:mevalonate kinase n=1 Tax=Streptococcus sp. DD12 TaxID=1777880 RepID=UPI0007957068|nr:mevalonate kinase [Streptococcus sp. DD12]KXT75782.1 Mevalonate kinase [Streptococcus sp. DD12]